MSEQALGFDIPINPYGCSPKAVEAMVALARSREYRFYGDETGASLREQLAAHFQLSPENFIVYNGSSEALVWLFAAHLLFQQNPPCRSRLILAWPSFDLYAEVGRRFGAEVIEIPLSPHHFSLDLDRVIELGRRQKGTVVVLTNPNNPTGNLLLDAQTLTYVLEQLPDCVVVVDEAYADYAGITFAPWVRERPNLVVVRTFSKAYGLAGLRIGYLALHTTKTQILSQFRIPWSADSMSLVAAQAALEDQGYLQRVVARIRADCADLQSAVRILPHFHVYPSLTNFFLVRMSGIDPRHLQTHLTTHGIRVFRRSDMPQYIRLSSLTQEANRHLLDVLNLFSKAQEQRPNTLEESQGPAHAHPLLLPGRS